MKLYTDQTITRDYLPEHLDLMERTKECLFIAGKAGTGKSTLLIAALSSPRGEIKAHPIFPVFEERR